MATMANSSESCSDSPPIPTKLEEQDKEVFGLQNEAFAEALASSVTNAISSGVQSLPLLKDTTKSQALTQTLRKAYLRNVDLVDAYGRRNIFSLRPAPPRRRQRIVQAFRMDPLANDSTSPVTASTPAPEPTRSYPRKEEIPSQQAVSDLQDQLQDLKQQLQTAQDQRKKLLRASQSLTVAKSVASQAVEAFQEIINEEIPGPVTAALMGGSGLQNLAEEGRQLQSQLKRQAHATDEEPLSDRLRTRKKLLTMEEAYTKDRQVVTATVQELSAVRKILRKKN